MAKIIVIGAGVMGASVAFRLAQAGEDVTILEAVRVGGGTSGISFAWTNSNHKLPRPYHDLNVAGMRAHAALAEEFGGTPWWHGGGRIEWEAEADQAAHKENVERLRSWGYAAEWISPAQVAELEPDLDLAVIGDAAVAYMADDGWLDPVVYAHAMVSAARRHGAKLELGVRVREVETQGARVVGVKAEDGRRFGADMVVNCAGRWANDAVLDSGLHIPLAPTVGLLVFTPPVACSLSHVLGNPICDMRPDGAGRLMLHVNEIDAKVAPDTTPGAGMPEARELVQRAISIFPGIGPVEPEAARVTQRPIPRDGLSAVGPVPRIEGYYLAITHSGVTLSPFLGKAVADEIAHGKQRPELASFRPERFFN
ncbi:MAG: FAD-binding oxidoreductase [Acidisphaera sp.]|nr:FAD-binding oxidoreductase [Acidisphaera sp.]